LTQIIELKYLKIMKALVIASLFSVSNAQGTCDPKVVCAAAGSDTLCLGKKITAITNGSPVTDGDVGSIKWSCHDPYYA